MPSMAGMLSSIGPLEVLICVAPRSIAIASALAASRTRNAIALIEGP